MRGLVAAVAMVLAAAAGAIAVNVVLLDYASPHGDSVGNLSPARGILHVPAQPTRSVTTPMPKRGHEIPRPGERTDADD